ncbi:hypothetical protein [Salibacterium lacus]|uniref:Pilus assembly protein PilO n=1 Tax=Salibacterium lacus TaxID=1898109 RepID=A0ABW5T1Y2_9BACI
MRIDMEKRHWIAVICVVLLLAGYAAFQYVNGIQPLSAEKERLQQNIQAMEAQLEERTSGTEEKEDEDSTLFQGLKQLPLQPRTEEFLLALDRAEELSGSYIAATERMEPGNTAAGDTEPEEESQEQETTGDTGQPDSESGTDTEAQPEENGTPVLYEETETGTAAYHVRARTPEYANLLRLVESLDNNNRVMNIDSISFQGREEIVQEDQERGTLTVDLVITAFHYTGEKQDLEDLPASSTLEEPDGNDNPIR